MYLLVAQREIESLRRGTEENNSVPVLLWQLADALLHLSVYRFSGHHAT